MAIVQLNDNPISLKLMIVLTVALTTLSASSGESGWSHDWATPASAWWGYGAMGGDVFSDEQVAFVAKTYRIVVLSMCIGSGPQMSASSGIMNVSARLKTLNAKVKVLQYFNVGQFACYSADDPEYKTFLSHPEWWLLDDNGNVLRTNGSPTIDFSKEDAVQFFLSMPISGHDGTNLIDGFLLDGAAGYDQPANVSATRAEALKLAKWKAAGRLQQKLTAANGGLVLANGMIGGPIDPHVGDPYNLGVLEYVNGIENERGTPTFELVNGSTGAFLLDAVAANLAAVEQASLLANGSKVVSMNYWAGPINGFMRTHDAMNGLPGYAPEDPNNHAPNGTRAEVLVAVRAIDRSAYRPRVTFIYSFGSASQAGWQQILLKWWPFNMASFLSVAGPSTYFTQMVWYAAYQGFVPCPKAPDSCCAPSPFYPDMHRPLGPPAGPRQQVGTYKWVRHFEHAVVTLDLEDPLGPGTSITWG